jgi:transposase
MEEPAEVLALRKELRDTRSRAIVKKIQEWAYAQTPLPGSGLASAIGYTLDRWRGLTLFLEDPRIPLDNNAAERSLRGVVIGRKNHLGSKSKRGAQVAAIFYTLFESAKLCRVEPKRYVLEAALRAIRQPGTVTLPHDLIA